MEEAILGLPEQFRFKPEIKEKGKLCAKYEMSFVIGMGGSHLCGGILKAINPSLPIYIRKDYGLPTVPHALKEKTLFVFVSYSGNTEETLDAFEEAVTEGLNVAVITTGGVLGARAEELSVPRVIIPHTGIQPRNAVGYSTLSLATVLCDGDSIKELQALSDELEPEKERPKGFEIAEMLEDSIPLIYASSDNEALAYNWKIKFNETTKIPSFYNVFPELNHNEMEGFGVTDSTRELSSPIAVCFLSDSNDHPRIRKRMEVTEGIYREHGIKSYQFELEGLSRAERIFRGLSVADWASLELSLSHYKTDYDNVPVIEKFKKLIK